MMILNLGFATLLLPPFFHYRSGGLANSSWDPANQANPGLTYLPDHVKYLSMADKSKKWADNQDGKFYVDDQCIDCDACRTEAPDHFRRNDEHGYSYVYNQPKTPAEEAMCKSALEACPVEAIGNDA